jgi:hypothetical protein
MQANITEFEFWGWVMKTLFVSLFLVLLGFNPVLAKGEHCTSLFQDYSRYPQTAAFATENGLPATKASHCGWSYNKTASEAHAISFCRGNTSRNCVIIAKHN